MGRHDWYRNTHWNSEIEAAYFEKLKRARHWTNGQYLCCQATCLIDTHPQVSLRLLEMYFDMGGNFEIAEAWAIKARAHSALGQ
jgi:hypothetical protein